MTAPTNPELINPALTAAVDVAHAAALETAGDEVGAHVGVEVEDDAAVTHLFDAVKPGYRGWCWAVTVASAGPDAEVTVSEVTLLPGPDALVAPEWVPWQDRVRAGDLGVGDLMPTAPDDPRLVPAYLASDDPAIEATATELGLGRARVMSRPARLDAAERWHGGEFGPRSDMARGAPARCGTCGFYLPVAGSLSAAFGVCGNEISPADGHLVHTEYGCGAHSEAEVEQVSPVLVADLIYDDATLDVIPVARTEPPTQAAPAKPAEPAQPAAEAAPAEPAARAEQATPAEPDAAAEPAEPTEPGAAAELAEPDAEAAPAEPAVSAVPEAAPEPTEPAEPAAEAEPAEPAGPAEPAAPAEPDGAAELAEPAAEAAPAEPAVSAEPAAAAEPAEPAGPAVDAAPAEQAAPAAPAQPAEPQAQAAQAEAETQATPTESAGPGEQAAPVEPDAAAEPAAAAEPTERQPAE